MLIQPPKYITQSLSSAIGGAQKIATSCLDATKFAAVHLKTPKDLSMFYQNSNVVNASTAAIVATIQVVVAGITLITAGLFAVNGHMPSSNETVDAFSEDILNMGIEGLLSARQQALIS